MPKLLQRKIVPVLLWAATVVIAGVGGYFAGWRAEAKYEDLTTTITPSPEMKLEQQGRYDEAIQFVLDRAKQEGFEAGSDSEVGRIYLRRAKADPQNREKWMQQAAAYFDKATTLRPKDPFVLEVAMDGFNALGDYSDKGCPYYEKAVGFGESALALLQGSTITIEGQSRSYPTEPIKQGIQPPLQRIRRKVDAWCRKTP